MPDPRSSMVMIVRHAEKPTTANRQRGVRPDGDHDRHSLSVRGWTRAGALVGLFVPQHGEPKAGLRRPDAIYASGHPDDGSRRPVQTVTPLAERLGQHIHRRRGLGDEEALAAKLAVQDGATLVAWHHEAIPDIARALGAVRLPAGVAGRPVRRRLDVHPRRHRLAVRAGSPAAAGGRPARPRSGDRGPSCARARIAGRVAVWIVRA